MKALRVSLFILAVTFIFSLWLAVAAQAQAQLACGSRDSFIAQLDAKYGETRHSMGLSNNSVVELFANEATGTWTILITSPEGTACMLVAGQAFQLEPSKLTPTGDPA